MSAHAPAEGRAADGVDVCAVKEFLTGLQQSLIDALEAFEPQARFGTDAWQRAEGGGGITRVLRGGAVFEQAGVGFSDVYGAHLPPSASAARPELAGRSFRAMGVSLVVHPRNPYAPTSHLNVRFFQALKEGAEPIWWFGGGFDLTPHYVFEDDARHWHCVAKTLCDAFDPARYSQHKEWCDRYFYLKHRSECRGIGGLFFDDLHAEGFDRSFAYMRAVGEGFAKAYTPIIQRRSGMAYGETQREFQRYRRGRYVEFNLVWDRGTLFGLQSGGRTESILMSLPPDVRFEYGYTPQPGSREAALAGFLQPRDWLA